jgi:hypothetical protein
MEVAHGEIVRAYTARWREENRLALCDYRAQALLGNRGEGVR